MTVYRWGQSLRTSGRGVTLNEALDVNKVGHELERIEKKCGDKYSDQDVVNAARSKRNPLHKAFEWNDDVAGEKYRREQARLMIRAVVHVPEHQDKPEPEDVRAFVAVQPDEKGRSYTSIHKAMTNADDRNFVLQEALNSLLHWRRRWRTLNEYADSVAVLNKVDEGIRELQGLVAKNQ